MGFDFLRRCHRFFRRRYWDEERARELLKEPGVAGLVAKPFRMNRLLQKARECVPGMESLPG